MLVERAGRYFVLQLSRLTGQHAKGSTNPRTQRIVRLGWKFHGAIGFLNWAIDQRLKSQGESRSASFYARALRKPVRHYFSDVSFDAIGGYCPELQFFFTLHHRLASILTNEAK